MFRLDELGSSHLKKFINTQDIAKIFKYDLCLKHFLKVFLFEQKLS